MVANGFQNIIQSQHKIFKSSKIAEIPLNKEVIFVRYMQLRPVSHITDLLQNFENLVSTLYFIKAVHLFYCQMAVNKYIIKYLIEICSPFKSGKIL
jgi:hypothetical protein